MNLNTSLSKKYRHLNMQERCKIEIYYNDGLSISEIARRLSKHKSTISREISRNSVIQRDTHLKEKVCYFADAAQTLIFSENQYMAAYLSFLLFIYPKSIGIPFLHITYRIIF